MQEIESRLLWNTSFITVFRTPCHEPAESGPDSPTIFISDPFSYYRSFYTWLFKIVFSSL